MAKRDKRPKLKQEPHPSKTPKAEPPPDSNRLNPSWQVSRLEMVDPFGWHTIEKDKLLEIRSKLASFESQTWNEILVRDKKRNHTVFVSGICKEAQDRLSEIGLGDIEEIVSLRLSGPERIWGIRHLSILILLWWDPHHQIWPSGHY